MTTVIMRAGLPAVMLCLFLLADGGAAFAHAVAEGDQGYIQEVSGVNLLPFIYLGAKHMVTGYDHILFLLGVIFFLYQPKHIALYVSLFALGHSTTMLLGVYFNIGINSYLIDAIIGLSVVYKSLDNMGAFQRWFGFQPNTKAATLIFGFFHGFGLSTKIIEYDIAPEPADEITASEPAEAPEAPAPERKQIHLPLIVPEEEIAAEADREAEPEPEELLPTRSITFLDEEITEEPNREPSRTAAGAGWLDEVDDGATMDFPARPNHLGELSRPPMDREEVKARVEYLFPRTETNWTVGSRSPRRAAG